MESIHTRVAGVSGVLVGALSLVMVPLYFVYSGPPPADNVLTRSLVTVAVFGAFLIHVVATRRVFGPGGGLAADIAEKAGLAYAVVTLISVSLEAGVALQYPDGSMDPTVDGPLANGIVLMHGPIARMLIAIALVATAIAVTRTRVLPRWVATGAVIVALVNLAFVPSLFFGTDPADFYAANGWGSTATIGSVFMLWTGAVGVALLRTRSVAASPTAPRHPVAA